MKVCNCTLPYINPKACERCANNDVDDFGLYSNFDELGPIIISDEDEAQRLLEDIVESKSHEDGSNEST